MNLIVQRILCTICNDDAIITKTKQCISKATTQQQSTELGKCASIVVQLLHWHIGQLCKSIQFDYQAAGLDPVRRGPSFVTIDRKSFCE